MKQDTFLYELDERPPFHKNLVYGLQWVMIAIPIVIVFSALCSAALQLDPAAQVGFAQRLLIITGLMTFLQSLFGHRYPVLEGPSSAVLLTFMVLVPYGLSAIEGGLIAGGVFLIIIYKLKAFKWLSSFFTPNIVGIILMLVALTLITYLYPLVIGVSKTSPYGDPHISALSLLIILFVSLASHWLGGFFQTTSMLAGIFFGFLLFIFQGKVSFGLVMQSGWFAFPSPFFGVWPSFSLPAILALLCTYLAVMINSIGSIEGISEIVGKEGLEDRIHRGIGMTGAGGLAAAALGVAGMVSYSSSPGVVLVSRVASRYVLTMCGVILVGCALIPKLWAFLTVIPSSVTASVLFVALSSQFIAGISVLMLGKKKIERREFFTVGIPLLLGVMVSVIPKPFFQNFPSAIASLLSNGLVVGILCGLLFEHLLFRQRRAKS